MAAPFVLVLPDGAIAGYHTLSSTAVNVVDWPPQTVLIPRYPLIPATLLGRLAVDRRQQGRGFGRYLLANALFRAVSREVASFAVTSTPRTKPHAAFVNGRASCRSRISP